MRRNGQRMLLHAGLRLCALLAAAASQAQLPTVSRSRLDSLLNPPTAPGGEAMRFYETRIDAGTLGEDDAPAEYVFRWTNTGDVPLAVVRVTTTCGCAVPAYDREPVLPGGEGLVKVTYRPKGHPGGFQRKIFVFTQLSAGVPTAVLELTGHVVSAHGSSADYPCVMGGLLLKRREVRITGSGPRTERIECMNASDEPMRITADRRMLPGCIGFESEPAAIGPGERGDLVIRFDPSKAPERLPGQIPLLLEGIDLPPAQRTLRIRIGEAE